jgi:translocation and assembly module TamB
MIRLLKNSFKPLNLFFYALIAAVFGLLFFIFMTTSGLKLTTQIAEKILKGHLSIEGVSGALAREIQAEKITFSTSERTFSIKNMHIKWRILALLRWHLKIKSLTADEVLILEKPLVSTKKVSKKADRLQKTISLPKLPIYLTIEDLEIAQVLAQSGKKIQLDVRNLKGKIMLTRTQLFSDVRSKFLLPIPMDMQFELSGNRKKYEFYLTLQGKNLDWKLAGHGDQKQLIFNTVHEKMWGGIFQADGWVKASKLELPKEPLTILSFRPKNKEVIEKGVFLEWYFNLRAKNVPLDPFLPLQLNGDLTGIGTGKQGKLMLELEKTLYYKNPISGKTILHFDYPAITAIEADFFSGKNTLSAQGKVTDHWDIRWESNIKNLSVFSPKIKGKLLTKGEVSGERISPKVSANFLIQNLKFSTFSAKLLDASIFFDLKDLQSSRIDFDAKELVRGIFKISNLSLSGQMKKTKKGLMAELFLKPGIFEYSLAGTKRKETFRGGFWNILFLKSQIKSNLDVHLMGGSHLEGSATLPNRIEKASRQEIKANLRGKIEDLTFLSGLTSPTVRNIRGKAAVRLNVNGTMQNPNIEGAFALKEGGAFLAVPNLNLRNIQLVAKGKGRSIRYQGQAYSEDTVLKLKGKTTFELKKIISKFKLNSDRFLVVNTPEIQVYAKPDLSAEIKDEETEVSGTILITEANINPLDFSTVIGMPDDVQYVGQKEFSGSDFSIKTHITVKLGEKVKLKYQGLTGDLTGKLEISSESGDPTTAKGQISIKDGEYLIKGRKLNIHRGNLIFENSPLGNPNLDIQATRKIQVHNMGGSDPNLDFGINEVLVGVNLTGNARRHKVRLFSEPSGLSQSDILSYLITGQSSSAGASAYLPLILEAADALGGGPASDFSDQIQKSFGFSDISIRKEGDISPIPSEKPSRGPALVLGKMLSPFLYINYSVSKLSSLGRLQAQYQFAKDWTLQVTGVPGDMGAAIDFIRSKESKN